MATAEQLKRKIETAGDLQSVVKTMKAMAAANIRQYETAAESLADYVRTVELGFQVLLEARPEAKPPTTSEGTGPVIAIVFGSDQGMCGNLNDRIASHFLDSLPDAGTAEGDLLLVVVGARLRERLGESSIRVDRTLTVPSSSSGIRESVNEIIMIIDEYYSRGDAGRVQLSYNRHRSGASFEPESQRLLPLDPDWLTELAEREWPGPSLPSFTVDWRELLRSLTRQHLFVSLFRSFAESLASENASRLASMQGAEHTIRDRLAELTTSFHRQRQSAITGELLDIISGSVLLEREAEEDEEEVIEKAKEGG